MASSYQSMVYLCFLFAAGNEVTFSLETASDYVKDDKASFYGFKLSKHGLFMFSVCCR